MWLSVEAALSRNCRRCVLLQRQRKVFWLTQRLVSSSRLTRTPNHYEVLGVAHDASPADIKSAFVARSKEIHPDINPKDPANHDRFITLSEAYSVLSKPSARREYDFSLSARLYYEQSLRQSAYGSHYPGVSNAPGSSSTGSYDGDQPEPFRDESIWYMRDRSKHQGQVPPDQYYGIKGVRKVSNMHIVLGCLVFMGFGAIMHFIAFRYSKNFNQNVLDERDRVNHAILKESRTQARLNGNERQLQLLQAKMEAIQEVRNGK